MGIQPMEPALIVGRSAESGSALQFLGNEVDIIICRTCLHNQAVTQFHANAQRTLMDDQQVNAEELALAEQHVADGERRVAEQRERIERLAANGHDTAVAVSLLQVFEETLDLMYQDRQRLRDKVARSGMS